MITLCTPIIIKIFPFFFTQYKNEWKERKFWRQKNKKSDFSKNKKVTKIDDIDISKILVSKEEPYGTKSSFKYFIGCNDNDVIRPLCIKLAQMTGYVRKFEGNTTMPRKVQSNMEKSWKSIEIEFDSKPVYGDYNKYIKTKIKIYAGRMITNFQSKKLPKEKAPCKCLSIIVLDSVIKAKKKYYLQTLLEDCKYEQEKIKTENLINDDLEKSELDESDSDSNDETESDNEKDNDESNK